jgi:Zn-dependent peptidase ImmA (M78 family)
MLARRENALNLMGELGIDPPPFNHAARLSEAPEAVAGRLRVALGVKVTQQAAFSDGWEAWNAWRSAAEELGVLVFQFPKVTLNEVRGLVFPRAPLPVVALNSKETVPEARAYTLIHELLHLMLFNANEESTALRDRRPDAEWSRIERFVEIASSHTLVPEDWLERELATQSSGAQRWTVPLIRSLARRFRITPSAVAARLRSSRRMSVQAYEAWRDEWDRYVATLGPARSGPSSPAQKTLGRSGRPFAQLVLQALGSNRITSVDAARYLDLRYHHFDELRERLVARRRDASGGE